jgi:hypothetical protein
VPAGLKSCRTNFLPSLQLRVVGGLLVEKPGFMKILATFSLRTTHSRAE